MGGGQPHRSLGARHHRRRQFPLIAGKPPERPDAATDCLRRRCPRAGSLPAAECRYVRRSTRWPAPTIVTTLDDVPLAVHPSDRLHMPTIGEIVALALADPTRPAASVKVI